MRIDREGSEIGLAESRVLELALFESTVRR